MQRLERQQVTRVLAIQLTMTLGLAAAGIVLGTSVALSILVGAGVCTLANAVFAFWVFRRYRAQEAGLLMMRFYGAELIKIILILALFSVAFAVVDHLNVPALLGAYLIVQVLPAMLASSARGAG